MNLTQPLIPDDLKALYIQRRRSEIPEIMESLRNTDYETIAHIGHRMKGNGVSFGFPEITDLGEQLENFAQTKSKEDIENALNKLVSWVGRQSAKEMF